MGAAHARLYVPLQGIARRSELSLSLSTMWVQKVQSRGADASACRATPPPPALFLEELLFTASLGVPGMLILPDAGPFDIFGVLSLGLHSA